MRKVLYFMAVMMLVPMTASAQDDMYFTSSKKVKNTKKSAYQAPEQSNVADTVAYRTYDNDDVIYNGDGIEDDGDVQANDTLYIDPYDTFSDGEGEWIGGFNGSVGDYQHTKRVLNWANLGSAIPVGSSLYWNLVNSPYSYDWNIYKVGSWAYVTPTWSNPLYHSFQFDVTWGMHNWFRPWRYSSWYSPWYGSYYGSYYGFYDPWDPWYGFGFGWNHGWYGGFLGGYHGWGYSHYYGFSGLRRTVSRDRAVAHFGRDNAVRVGTTNRSALRGGSQQHRVTDNRVERTTRASGHSVRQENTNGNNSVRSGARNMGRDINASETRSSSVIRRTGDGQVSRGNSTYTRSSDGRTRSTYTRPSSTRSAESVGNQRTTDRSSGVRSMSEVRRQSSTETRSVPVNRSNSRSSMGADRSGNIGSGRSSGFESRGGGFSGGSRGGGMSGGGMRGGSGGGRGRR